MAGPWRDEKVRIPRAEAQKFVDLLEREFPKGLEWYICGSWRRGAPDIGDFDILVVTSTGTFAGIREVLPASFRAEHEGPQVIQGKLYTEAGSYTDVIAGEPTEVRRWSGKAMNADFYACTPDQRAACLMFLTGPKALNIVQRTWAKKIGFKLSQYGLFTLSDNYFIPCRTEEQMYERLGLNWIDPEDRQKYADAKPPNDAAILTWDVPSRTDQRKTYLVKRRGEPPNAFWSCEDKRTGEKCLGFKYSRKIPATCGHIDLIKQQVGKK